MIKRLINKLRKPKEATTPHIPENQRIYCIGDIHGRADLLKQLHAQILADATAYPGKITIVYLGDYIDRGEQSREVVELLLSNPLPDFTPVYLMGNHEQLILSFLKYPEESISWLSYGGIQALNSYGVPLAHIPSKYEVIELSRQLGNKLPETHRTFFRDCVSSWECGSYFFAHAGIEPGVALDRQLPEDLLWIREEFLESRRDHGAIIVHGHSITKEPAVYPNRIGIDTGAFRSGVLTCLVLEANAQRFIQTTVKMDSGSSPE